MAINRRNVVVAGAGLSAVVVLMGTAIFGQEAESYKPVVYVSKIRPVVAEHVDQMAKSAEENMGYEWTDEEKAELTDEILQSMEDQGTYAFLKE